MYDGLAEDALKSFFVASVFLATQLGSFSSTQLCVTLASVVDLWCKVSIVLRFAQATRASASLGRLHPMMSPSIDLSLAITAVAIKQMMVGPR